MTKKLLLVDDELNILQSLERLLSQEGYEIYTASSGKEGLEILSNNPIQVVICDQRMPVMTGVELLTEVKKTYPNIICMILSAYTDFKIVQLAINEGLAYKFLNKPWKNDQLINHVREAFAYYDTQIAAMQSSKLDRLTGLYNRFEFVQIIDELLTKHNAADMFAILRIDLEHFSQFNEGMNETIGDEVLKEVAQRLKTISFLEKEIARLGSDEFAVIIKEVSDQTSLESKVNTIIATLRNPLNIQDKTILLHINIGAAIYPIDGDRHNNLMANANLALKSSKMKGSDNFQLYEANLAKSIISNLSLTSDIHKALDNREFVLYYQPIVNREDLIIGMEALIRWQHPTQGILSPDKFLALAEETGLIIPIGKWVIETACQDIKQWITLDYPDLHVAVNLSAKQFTDPGLYEFIAEILEKYKLPPSALILEITESLTMQDVDFTIKTLQAFKELGLKLSLDDFGTGYSSLKYLSLFPIDILKIDQSFVKKLTSSKHDLDILLAIINMSKTLNLANVAEAVETLEISNILKTTKCEFQQGYYFYKPMPAMDIVQALSENKAKTKK